MGSAPASGAADDALVVGITVRGCGSKQYGRHPKVRREGAPNSSRGGLRSGSGPLAARHFINLGKFTGAGAAVEFINCFLGEILPSGDVDGSEPTLLPPAPGGALRHPPPAPAIWKG